MKAAKNLMHHRHHLIIRYSTFQMTGSCPNSVRSGQRHCLLWACKACKRRTVRDQCYKTFYVRNLRIKLECFTLESFDSTTILTKTLLMMTLLLTDFS